MYGAYEVVPAPGAVGEGTSCPQMAQAVCSTPITHAGFARRPPWLSQLPGCFWAVAYLLTCSFGDIFF